MNQSHVLKNANQTVQQSTSFNICNNQYKIMYKFWRSTLFALILLALLHIGHTIQPLNDGKLRVCIVESRGIYRKTPKFCPILEATSNMECVVGVDRLDCVRRIHKGTAHFGVLSPEDLVAARWASVEILVGNELRSHDSHFEYEVVAIIDNEADIHSVHDLSGARFCHPGYDLGNHWSETLANYFESTIVAKSCDPSISITEDRIRASAKFFGPSCKAGPWVPDPIQDRLLKDRYPSLCQMCYDPVRCDVSDKHWGRRGALYCLTSGGGNVAWARLVDVRSHFGFTGLPPQAEQSEYSYLCADGHLQPLNTTRPCVWVARPWPVIAARRSHAAQVQKLVTGLTHDDPNSWQNALLSLLETYHVDILPLDNVIPIDDYLDQATGFQSAYSFPECNPPRSIVYCTTSIIEHIKCSWLQESALVYGIQPNIQCIRSNNLDSCMDDTQYKAADIVLVDHENRVRAQRDYGLVPLLYEFSYGMHDRYATIAVVHKHSTFMRFTDLRGKKACLPSYEGAGYLSVLDTIHNHTEQHITVRAFFHRDSCTWHPKASDRACPEIYRGDEGALRCLAEGGDVAFLSSDAFKRYVAGNISADWVRQTGHKPFKVLCPFGGNERGSKFEYCYLHWTTRGHLMTHNATTMRRNEIYFSLREMDRQFGSTYKSDTRPFTMYGVFDQKSDIMFHDKTDSLKSLHELRKDPSQRQLEAVYTKYSQNYYHSLDNASAQLRMSLLWHMPFVGLLLARVLT